jgi:hypothetical protein
VDDPGPDVNDHNIEFAQHNALWVDVCLLVMPVKYIAVSMNQAGE